MNQEQWDELKRHVDEFQGAVRGCAIHGDKEAFVEEVEATKDALLTAILAKRSAAQRLRDAVGSYYGWGEMNMPPELLEVVAAFDKETE